MAVTASANPARRRRWPAPNGLPKTSRHSRAFRWPVSTARFRSPAGIGIFPWRRWARALSDADLAAVLTYIRESWGNKYGAVSADEVKAARAAISGNAPSAAELAKMTPVERGHIIFQKYGCFQCHGQDAKGGVPNPNAKTAEQVPSLIYVADGYTKDELINFIKRGERDIPVLNPDGPPPPHFMPYWGNVIKIRTQRNDRLSLQSETQGRQPGLLTAGSSVPAASRFQFFRVHSRSVRGLISRDATQDSAEKVRAHGGRFAIVASRYNARYVDAMLRAAKAELWRAEVSSIEVVRVPARMKFPSWPNTSHAWPILSTSTPPPSRRTPAALRRIGGSFRPSFVWA